MTTKTITRAVQNLRPGAEFSLVGDSLSGLVWKDETQTRPTDAEILLEVAIVEQLVDVTNYQRLRQRAYNDRGATIDALIVALWESVLLNDNTARDLLESVRQQVKAEFPNPSSEKP